MYTCTKLYFISIMLLSSVFFNLSANGQQFSFDQGNGIGVSPSFSKRPSLNKGEFDLNIFPVTIGLKTGPNHDQRVTFIANLGFRERKNHISDIGAELAMPLHFQQRVTNDNILSGFYIAPVIRPTMNFKEELFLLGLMAEPGYTFAFDDEFSISVGVKAGAIMEKEMFDFDDKKATWGPFYYLSINFLLWY